MGWLSEALAACTLSDEGEGYLLGRGAKQESIAALGCVTWEPASTPSPDPSWKRYGPEGRGEYLAGRLIIPMLSPRGDVLGFEARRMDVKDVTRYLLPEASWNPVWMGMSLSAMQRIWAGGDIWIGEGIFDVFPLEWAIPPTDVALGSGRAKLTPKHVEFLRRFCRGWVNIVYDNDETGRKGVHGWVDETGKRRWGALQQLRHVGVNARHIPYTGGKDPGELWDRFGPKGVRAEFGF